MRDYVCNPLPVQRPFCVSTDTDQNGTVHRSILILWANIQKGSSVDPGSLCRVCRGLKLPGFVSLHYAPDIKGLIATAWSPYLVITTLSESKSWKIPSRLQKSEMHTSSKTTMKCNHLIFCDAWFCYHCKQILMVAAWDGIKVNRMKWI